MKKIDENTKNIMMSNKVNGGKLEIKQQLYIKNADYVLNSKYKEFQPTLMNVLSSNISGLQIDINTKKGKNNNYKHYIKLDAASLNEKIREN